MTQQSYTRVLTQVNWKLNVYKKTCMYVYSGFIHNHQKLDASKMSFNMSTAKVVHVDKGMLLNAKKKYTSEPWKDTEEPPKHIAKWKKSFCKAYVLYGSNYRTFWKRQNYKEVNTLVAALMETRSGFRNARVAGCKRDIQKNISGDTTALYGTLVVDTWLRASVRTHTCILLRVTFNVYEQKNETKHQRGGWEMPGRNVDCDKWI